MHPSPKRILPIVLLLAAAGAAAWWYFAGRVAADPGALAAAGTIEAVSIDISPELGGRVLAVNADEGQAVRAGDALVQLDASLLQAQRQQAQAALAAAEANYALLSSGASAEQLKAAVAQAELQVLSAQQALDDLHEHAAVATAQAQAEVARARDALDKAQRNLRNLTSPDVQFYRDRVKDAEDALATAQENVTVADIGALSLALENARDRLKNATELYDDAKSAFEQCPDCTTVFAKGRRWEWDDVAREYQDAQNAVQELEIRIAQAQRGGQSAVDKAQDNLKDAQDRLADVLDGPSTLRLGVAEADVAVAQAALTLAEDKYARLEGGPDPDQLALAEARLASAKAGLQAARAALAPEQLDAARAQREAAQAALALLDVQIQKLTLIAPADGVVLARAIQPGEVASPGAVLLVLGRLDTLDITVYVPETQYGDIRLGQQAQVSVDSYAGEHFTASVTHIADQAEFTPRNVQTAQGRKSTVFAIKLSIQNPEGKLKPGMPADVDFGN